jgi:hypothetical protein
MRQRPGCLAPISLVFIVGCLLLLGGLMSESVRAVRAGVGFLFATAGLLVAGWWLRQRGWWQ